MKKIYLRLLTIGIVIIVSIILVKAFGSISNSPNIGPLGSEHSHSSWDLIVNGRNLTDEVFSKPQYQLRHRYVHMEDNTIIIHKHATGITFGFFLETLGVKWDKKCLTIEQNNYCTDSYDFKFYVNGLEKDNFYNYEMRENDRLKLELKSN